MTLQLIWEEHRAVHPDSYGYSRFCELYRAWAKKLSPTMRQTHTAGERLFVDYAGTTLEVFDGVTGEVLTAQLFVATLGASSYTYAEATWTQTRPLGSPPAVRGCPTGSALTRGPSSSSAASRH